jgi:hypothetical protein
MTAFPPPNPTASGITGGQFVDKTRFTKDPGYEAMKAAEAKHKDDQQFVTLVTALAPVFRPDMSDLEVQQRLESVWQWWSTEQWTSPKTATPSPTPPA